MSAGPRETKYSHASLASARDRVFAGGLGCGLVALALASLAACDGRIALGHLPDSGLAPDGASSVDGGLVDDAGVPRGPEATLQLSAATASLGQRGLALSVNVQNREATPLSISVTPTIDGAAPATRGFWLVADASNLGMLAASGAARFRFTLDLETPAQGLPSRGAHVVCATVEARTTEGATELPTSTPCTSLLAETPAALDARLKTAPILYQGETREAVLQLIDEGDAPAVGLRYETSAQIAGQPGVPEPHVTLSPESPPDAIAGNATIVARFALRASDDAPPGQVDLGASVTARDGNDGTRLLRAQSEPQRIEVRPVARVSVVEVTADRANVRPGDREVTLSLRARNAGLGDALLSTPTLAFQDATGADVTSSWSVRGADAIVDEPLPAGGERVFAVRAVLAAAATAPAEHIVSAAFVVRTNGRAEIFEAPGPTARPWHFSVVPVPTEDLPPPDGYGASTRYGAALALLNDPEDGPSIFVVGAPGLAGGGVLAFVAPLRSLGALELPAGGEVGAALAGVGHWSTALPQGPSRDLAVGAPGRGDFFLVDPIDGPLASDDIPAASCAACGLGAALAGNPRGERDGATPGSRLLLAVGAPSAADGAGRVDVIWQPAPGWPLQRATRMGSAGERFGAALAVLDLDGDGTPSVVVGAPGYRASGDAAQRGRVYVLRPPDYTSPLGAPWSHLEGEAAGDELGAAVASAGDLDGDGRDDLVIGAPGHSVGGVPSAGRALLVSGATGARLATFDGHGFSDSSGVVRGERFGAAVDRLTTRRGPTPLDFNGDGHPDLAIGAPSASPGGRRGAGSVYVVGAPPAAGLVGRVLLRLDGIEEGGAYGAALTHLGDNDADGYQDLLVGAPLAAAVLGGPRGGRVEFVRGRSFSQIVVAPRIDFVRIDDGATGQPPRRGVTRGGPPVSVALTLRNAGDSPLANVRASLHLLREDGSVVADADAPIAALTPALPSLLQDETAVAAFAITVPEALPTGLYQLAVRVDTSLGASELPPSSRHLWIVQRPPKLRVLAPRVVTGNTDRGFLSLGRGTSAVISADALNTGDAPATALLGEVALQAPEGGSTAGVVAVVDAIPSTTRLEFGDALGLRVTVTATDEVTSGERLDLRLRVRAVDGNTGDAVASDLAEETPVFVVTSRATIRVLAATTSPLTSAGAAFVVRLAVAYPFDALAAADATLVSERADFAFDRGGPWLVAAPQPLASVPMCADGAPCAGTLFDVRIHAPAELAPGPVSAAPRFGALDVAAHPLGVFVEGGPDPDAFPAGVVTFTIE